MTVFRGYTHDENDLKHWANTLTIENAEGVLPDKVTAIPLVQVDTNYKPDRTGNHPVNLSISDTLKAAASLISVAHESLSEFDDTIGETFDDLALLGLLANLTDVDGALWELRVWLHAELESRHQDDAGADEAVTTAQVEQATGLKAVVLNPLDGEKGSH